jgi:hypothetical protein
MVDVSSGRLVLLMLTALIDSDDKQNTRAKRARTEDPSQIPPVIDEAERKRYENSSLSTFLSLITFVVRHLHYGPTSRRPFPPHPLLALL